VERYRQALRAALRGETKAYGFTLVVWGTGELLTAQRGQPGKAGAIAFMAGILTAMGLTLIAAFHGLPRTEHRSAQQHFGFGGVHILAVPVAMAVGWALGAAIHTHWPAYLLAGFGASSAYQLLLGLEVLLTPSP
jgi:hypothetical protein